MELVVVPWTRVEREMLAHCVEEGMDWERAARCVQHLGTRAGRSASHCAVEYQRMTAEWTYSSRVLPTAQKVLVLSIL